MRNPGAFPWRSLADLGRHTHSSRLPLKKQYNVIYWTITATVLSEQRRRRGAPNFHRHAALTVLTYNRPLFSISFAFAAATIRSPSPFRPLVIVFISFTFSPANAEIERVRGIDGLLCDVVVSGRLLECEMIASALSHEST